LKKFIDFILFSLILSLSFAQFEWSFTNCGNTGQYGPTMEQCEAEYEGTALEGQVTMPAFQGYQEWTVPFSGIYTIEALGARGANGFVEGGMGVSMKGDFVLEEGETIKINDQASDSAWGSSNLKHAVDRAWGTKGEGSIEREVN
jgi:hypothetical protein